MNENIPDSITEILRLERELDEVRERGMLGCGTAVNAAYAEAIEQLGWTEEEVRKFVSKCRIDDRPRRQNTVKVTVSGAIGSGKTTICRLLAKALQDAGIMHVTDDDSLGVCRDQPLERCVEGLKKMNTTVQISTHQTPRVPK